MEGTSSALLGAVRGAAMSSTRGKLGGMLLRPALRSLRDEIDPQEQGGAVLLGLRKLGVVPHGSFGARGFARAIEVAARGVRLDVAGRTHDRLSGGRGVEGVRAGRYGARPAMTRDEVLELIRDASGRRAAARPGADHRADPLPQRPECGLARPLHARAGARGHLRGQDVRRGGGAYPDRGRGGRLRAGTSPPRPRAGPSTASRDPDRCARSQTCWNRCRTISPGRRSRTPPGSSSAATPTSGSPSWATRCSGWRSRRTCIRGWRATAPGG